MPIYINPWPYSIELLGPSGERIKIKPRSKRDLPEYYDKFVKKGYINREDGSVSKSVPKPIKRSVSDRNFRNQATSVVNQPEIKPTRHGFVRRSPVVRQRNRPGQKLPNRKVVGREIAGDASKIFSENSSIAPYRISNGIGVAILSYNRGDSLARCIDSIKRNTDLDKTSIFVVDDGSDDQRTITYLNEISKDNRICVLRNKKNLGISGNSNRALRCLSRFNHLFLLNDDVEILTPGWESFYISASERSGIHHLIYRQVGVYGAQKGSLANVNGQALNVIQEKPHGAFLYMTGDCFKKIGYFNEDYKGYGMEHVDWSAKPSDHNIQPKGYFDVEGSERFVRIINEKTSFKNKMALYTENRKKFENRIIGEVLQPSEITAVPSISCIIPVRDINRNESIKTVVMGIVGQNFPDIEIIIAEQDDRRRLDSSFYSRHNHVFVKSHEGDPFNKSKAFNVGVSHSKNEFLILHDADMLARSDYVSNCFSKLQDKSSAHICGRVLYCNKSSTEAINGTQRIGSDTIYERIVGYFEGGSLISRKKTFWEIGGFNEDYKGYGCEDCDFYSRISSHNQWESTEDHDLIHLWHPRTSGWNEFHKKNKELEKSLSVLDIRKRIEIQVQQAKKLGYVR